MNFVAIDVETANAKRAICQIGIAKYTNGIKVDEWDSLINPEVDFEARCIEKHKIQQHEVLNKPKFYEIYDKLNYFMEGSVCVFHSGFDKDAIEKVFNKYSLEPFNFQWIDSCKVAKRVWPEHENHKLKTLCEKIGFQLKNHHNALDDAIASAEILLAAIKDSNLDFDELIEATHQLKPQNKSSASKKVSLRGNIEGRLYGEVALFTGALLRMKIDEASSLIANCGADVVTSISKKVTILIAGTQNPSTLKGKANSTSYLTAEKYIAEGHNIRILNESDFFELIYNLSHK